MRLSGDDGLRAILPLPPAALPLMSKARKPGLDGLVLRPGLASRVLVTIVLGICVFAAVMTMVAQWEKAGWSTAGVLIVLIALAGIAIANSLELRATPDEIAVIVVGRSRRVSRSGIAEMVVDRDPVLKSVSFIRADGTVALNTAGAFYSNRDLQCFATYLGVPLRM